MSRYKCRQFSTASQKQTENLVARIRHGGEVCVKPVDYEGLHAAVREGYMSGQKSLLKVKSLEARGHQQRQQSLGQRHRFIWCKELGRLQGLLRQYTADVEVAVERNLADDDMSLIFAELDHCDSLIEAAFREYQRSCSEKLESLREKVKEMIEIKSLTNHLRPSCKNELKLKSLLDSMKEENMEALASLSAFQSELENDLNIDGLMDHCIPPDKHVETGIPEEAFSLECPNLVWKASMLEEFILLDGGYVERLNEHEKRYEQIVKRENGGWTSGDHSIFLYLSDQYMSQDIRNRRQLFIDLILRHLPHKSRGDIVEHEEWLAQIRLYASHRRDLLSDWLRDRAELTNRITVIFQERCTELERQNIFAESRQKQKILCDELYRKVREWREKKMEAMRLQQGLLEADREMMERRVEEERQVERQKRQAQKQQIRIYHDEMESRRRDEEKRDRERLDEIQRELDEQATKDRERVRYRRGREEGRRRDVERRKQDEEAADVEREKILEQIREKVRPHVEGDLMRLWSDTLSWKQRQQTEDLININRPLFDVNSYTSNQIEADPRVRLEQRLREAGLHDTGYARDVMTQMKPLRAPRKDTLSTVFKQ